jgi:hypothetical protein
MRESSADFSKILIGARGSMLFEQNFMGATILCLMAFLLRSFLEFLQGGEGVLCLIFYYNIILYYIILYIFFNLKFKFRFCKKIYLDRFRLAGTRSLQLNRNEFWQSNMIMKIMKMLHLIVGFSIFPIFK